MAGAEFRIRADGEGALERDLAQLGARVGDLTPLMDIITGVMLADTEDNFEGEHDPNGVPWLPSRRATRDGGKTLQDTRRLRLSMAGRHTATTAEIGTNVGYANRHQQGFKGQETVEAHKRTMKSVFGMKLREPIEVAVGSFTRTGNTPARPFLGLSAHARVEIGEHAADYLGAEQ